MAGRLLRRIPIRDRGHGESVTVSFDDLVETPPDELVPPLDRADVDLKALTPAQRSWRESGVVILPGLIPEALLEPYVKAHRARAGTDAWPLATTYLGIPECMDLCLYAPLTSLLRELIGDEMGLHLNLWGWKSTERNWHQDDYLNPEYINSWYAAVWFALDDIDPRSGPFQYVPGSHAWPVLRRDKVRALLEPEQAASTDWPKYTERFLTELAEQKMLETGAHPETFLARKGDVLVWHGRLLHRGSPPEVPGMERRALIAHYSALSKRDDMPARKLHVKPELNVQGWYFDLPVW
jgi:phytanoyl-CoA dioxygenase PhyH